MMQGVGAGDLGTTLLQVSRVKSETWLGSLLRQC
jgi:hypothetical protein